VTFRDQALTIVMWIRDSCALFDR